MKTVFKLIHAFSVQSSLVSHRSVWVTYAIEIESESPGHHLNHLSVD